MSETSKKKPRKSKLVARTYDDMEDESTGKPKSKRAAITVPPKIEVTVDVQVEEDDGSLFQEIAEGADEGEKEEKTKDKEQMLIEYIGMKPRQFFYMIKESGIKKLMGNNGVFAIDTSTKLNYEDSQYNLSLLQEIYLTSPFTSVSKYCEPKKLLKYSYSVSRYQCLPCRQNFTNKFKFLRHLSIHVWSNRCFFVVVPAENNMSCLVATIMPSKYTDNHIVIGDVGRGNPVSLTKDYATAINYVILKWNLIGNQEKVINGILSYKCYVCRELFEYYAQFLTHLNAKHQTEKLFISSEVLLTQYLNIIANDKMQTDFIDLSRNAKLDKYKCFKCKRVFKTLELYSVHMKRQHVCCGCGSKFTCSQLKDHEGRCRNFLDVFYPKMCPCKQEFSRANVMIVHQRFCKFGRTALGFHCVVCKYLAPNTMRLMIHQRLEHHVRSDEFILGSKVRNCFLCGQGYVGTYNQHHCSKRLDTEQCNFCGQLFQNDFFLRVHVKAFIGNAKCHKCEDYFEHSCAKIEHDILQHELPMVIKYQCTICNVIFDDIPLPNDGRHIVHYHRHVTNYFYDYKKLYLPKVLNGMFGYATGIYITEADENVTPNTSTNELVEDNLPGIDYEPMTINDTSNTETTKPIIETKKSVNETKTTGEKRKFLPNDDDDVDGSVKRLCLSGNDKDIENSGLNKAINQDHNYTFKEKSIICFVPAAVNCDSESDNVNDDNVNDDNHETSDINDINNLAEGLEGYNDIKEEIIDEEYFNETVVKTEHDIDICETKLTKTVNMDVNLDIVDDTSDVNQSIVTVNDHNKVSKHTVVVKTEVIGSVVQDGIDFESEIDKHIKNNQIINSKATESRLDESTKQITPKSSGFILEIDGSKGDLAYKVKSKEESTLKLFETYKQMLKKSFKNKEDNIKTMPVVKAKANIIKENLDERSILEEVTDFQIINIIDANADVKLPKKRKNKKNRKGVKGNESVRRNIQENASTSKNIEDIASTSQNIEEIASTSKNIEEIASTSHNADEIVNKTEYTLGDDETDPQLTVSFAVYDEFEASTSKNYVEDFCINPDEAITTEIIEEGPLVDNEQETKQPIRKARKRRRTKRLTLKKPSTIKVKKSSTIKVKKSSTIKVKKERKEVIAENTMDERDSVDEGDNIGEDNIQEDNIEAQNNIEKDKIEEENAKVEVTVKKEEVTIKTEIKDEFEEFETDLIIFTEEYDYTNGVLEEKFVEVNSKTIQRDDYKHKPKIYYCTRCEYTGHHRGYKEHAEFCKFKKKNTKTVPRVPRLPTTFKYNCNTCSLECDDLRDFLKHLPEHGYEELQCPRCNNTLETLNKLAEHALMHIKADFRRICFLQKSNKTKEIKKFRCSTCKIIVDQQEFFSHWQVHFDNVTVKKPPPEDRMPPPTLDALRNANKYNHGIKLEPFVRMQLCNILTKPDLSKVCFVCNRPFSRLHDIKRHLIEHLTMDALALRHDIGYMKCQLCSDEFPKTDFYKRHMRDHALLPLYQCQICDKSFSDSSNFGKHKKVHDVFEYICDKCKRKFQSKVTLEKHMLEHEKHDIIQCQYCMKTFYFPTTYRKHVKAVHNRSPTRCRVCRVKFQSMKELWDHEWQDHDMRRLPFDCPICNKGFRRVADLRKHIKRAHGFVLYSGTDYDKMAEQLRNKANVDEEKINAFIELIQISRKRILTLG